MLGPRTWNYTSAYTYSYPRETVIIAYYAQNATSYRRDSYVAATYQNVK